MEPVHVKGRTGEDHRGRIVQIAEDRTIDGCTVFPAGQSKINDLDIEDGDVTTLSVLMPAGTSIAEGEWVSIRGVEYRVKHVPFDWSVGRRPVLSRHHPKVQITVERGEA